MSVVTLIFQYPATAVPEWVGPLFISLVLGVLVIILGRILWVTIREDKKMKRRERESREGSSQT